MNTLDIAWAAGFLEGEGCIDTRCTITAAQVQKEPLERLIKIFGGKIRYITNTSGNSKPIWAWRLGLERSAQVAMTIYTLMSPKRQTAILRALNYWKRPRTKKQAGSLICFKGHKIVDDNAAPNPGHKYPRCRLCINLNARLKRKEKHSVLSI